MNDTLVVIALVFFCFMNYLAIRDIHNYISLMKNGVETSGEIEETIFYFRRSVTIVHYEVGSRVYKEKSIEFMFNTLYENGTLVKIKYDSENPSKFLIIGDTNISKSIVFIVASFILCGIACYYL